MRNKKLFSILCAVTISLTACTGTSSVNETGTESKAETSVAASKETEKDTKAETGKAETSAETTAETIAETTAETTAEKTEPADYTLADYAKMTPEEIVATLTLKQKANQMVQPAIYCVSEDQVAENCYGSILSKYESVDASEWCEIVDGFQKLCIESEAGIPYIYGQDDVHGVNYALNTVIFPHNIGMGAANDPELMYQVGLITADEAKLCHMLWNFAPCVAQSVDPRWGRTYESYGADLDIITSLSTSYAKGLIDGGVVACAKHFFADGNVTYGTGEKSDSDRIIDRGDSTLSDEEIEELLKVYQALVDTGVQTVMISHSSLNGLKMHENAKYIQYLKNEMGFNGFIVSDWNSVQNTSAATYREQVINAVNAGIDMLMEVERYDAAAEIIVNAVNDGDISEERVNDAVCRIIKVKKDQGLFDDPYCEKMETKQTKTGSDEYRAVALQAVEESLVLIKNDNNVLPIKSGTSVYISGPAADNAQAQCGGWTIDWNSSPSKKIQGVTTIKKGFMNSTDKFGIEIVDNIDDADLVILVVGEDAYAEWYGDTRDLELCGELGLVGNRKAIQEAEKSGKPVVCCIVAGRQVIIDEYYDQWDAVVMCYLPGSEGQGVANVLCGEKNFHGKLPSLWYSSVDQIGTGEYWLDKGYGLTY